MLYIRIVFKRAVEHHFTLVAGFNFLHSAVDQFQLEVLKFHALLGFDLEHTFVVKEKRQRAACAQRAAMLGEI